MSAHRVGCVCLCVAHGCILYPFSDLMSINSCHCMQLTWEALLIRVGFAQEQTFSFVAHPRFGTCSSVRWLQQIKYQQEVQGLGAQEPASLLKCDQRVIWKQQEEGGSTLIFPSALSPWPAFPCQSPFSPADNLARRISRGLLFMFPPPLNCICLNPHQHYLQELQSGWKQLPLSFLTVRKCLVLQFGTSQEQLHETTFGKLS